MTNYFITYGSKEYKYSKIHLIELAKISNHFDKFISLGPNDLSKNFVENLMISSNIKEAQVIGFGNMK